MRFASSELDCVISHETRGCGTHRGGSVCEERAGLRYLRMFPRIGQLPARPALEIVYHFYGLGHHCHLRLKTDVSEKNPSCPDHHRHLAHGGLARARKLRHDGIRFRVIPTWPHFDVGRYPYFPSQKISRWWQTERNADVAFSKTAPSKAGRCHCAGAGTRLN